MASLINDPDLAFTLESDTWRFDIAPTTGQWVKIGTWKKDMKKKRRTFADKFYDGMSVEGNAFYGVQLGFNIQPPYGDSHLIINHSGVKMHNVLCLPTTKLTLWIAKWLFRLRLIRRTK